MKAEVYMNRNELLRKMRDPKFYLENLCKIKGKTPGLVPFILNEAQKDLFNTVRKYTRVIINKARQIGFSTAVTGLFYHRTITIPGTNTALIGYNSDLTAELLDKVKTFYRTTPDSLKPTIHYNSKYEISFPKLDSKILVLPSTENVGKGYTINNCLITELSSWEKAAEKMMVLEASVPVDGTIIIESTPHGQGNKYHQMFMNAKDETEDVGREDYVRKEYGWWVHYTEEEIEIIRKRMNDPMRFAQEYGLEFLASGRPVFDAYSIRRQRKNELKVGDEVKYKDGSKKKVYVDKYGLRVYREPEAEVLYVVGVDTSEGVEGGDYTGVTIWNRMTGEEVAMYKGLIAPDILGEMINRWGRWYNNALMVVEINNHGLTTVTILKQLLYPSLYFRPAKFEVLGQPWSDKLGWKTTKVTRPLLIDDFAQAVRDDLLIIHSKELLDEMSVFVYDKNNNMTAQEGFHDDLIFCSGIGYQGFKALYDKPLDQLDYTKYLPTNYNY